MSPADLRAVPSPEPGPEEEEPASGEGAPSAPTTGCVTAANEERHREGQADGERRAGEQSTPVAPPARPDDDPDDEDEPRRLGLGLGIMTVPKDLGQYCDPRELRVFGPLVVEAGRRGGPVLLRALRVLARGGHVLLSLLYAWMSGDVGTWPKTIASRLLATLLGMYVVARCTAMGPAAPWAVAGTALLTVTLAGLGRLPIPGTTKSAKKSKEKHPTTPAKAGGAESPRASPATWFRSRRRVGRQSPVEVAESTPEGEWEETVEEDEEGVPPVLVEDPAGVSREDLIEALHDLLRGGRGVLLTALRDHLKLPHTRAVKEALDEAAIRWRAGVRSTIGSGPGVHRDDVPPLPLSRETSPGPGVGAGQEPTPTPTPSANASEEGLRVGLMEPDGFVVSPDDDGRFFTV